MGGIMRCIVATAVAASVLLASACSGAGGPNGTGPNGPGPGPDGQATPEAPWLAGLREVFDLERQIEETFQRLTVQCMEEQGFTVHPHQEPPQALVVEFSPPLISPQVTDAQQTGYQIGTSAAESTPPDAAPIDDPFSRLPRNEQDRYNAALLGQGTTGNGGAGRDVGCLGWARGQTIGAAATGAVVTQAGLDQEMRQEFSNDQRITQVYGQWSTCLNQAGYPQFGSPREAAEYAGYFHYPVGGRPPALVPEGGPWPPAEAKAKEIDLAVADATCADQTGLRETTIEVWNGVVSSVLAGHEAEIYARRDQLRSILDSAQGLLSQ